jgi:hypothetical protein
MLKIRVGNKAYAFTDKETLIKFPPDTIAVIIDEQDNEIEIIKIKDLFDFL